MNLSRQEKRLSCKLGFVHLDKVSNIECKTAKYRISKVFLCIPSVGIKLGQIGRGAYNQAIKQLGQAI